MLRLIWISANPIISERDKRPNKEFYRFAWRQ